MFKQTLVYSNDDQGRVTKIVWPHPQGRASCARVWPYKSYSENALSSTLSIYITLIAIVFKELLCCFPMLLLFFIYSMMELLIYKYEPF